MLNLFSVENKIFMLLLLNFFPLTTLFTHRSFTPLFFIYAINDLLISYTLGSILLLPFPLLHRCFCILLVTVQCINFLTQKILKTRFSCYMLNIAIRRYKSLPLLDSLKALFPLNKLFSTVFPLCVYYTQLLNYPFFSPGGF